MKNEEESVKSVDKHKFFKGLRDPAGETQKSADAVSSLKQKKEAKLKHSKDFVNTVTN